MSDLGKLGGKLGGKVGGLLQCCTGLALSEQHGVIFSGPWHNSSLAIGLAVSLW